MTDGPVSKEGVTVSTKLVANKMKKQLAAKRPKKVPKSGTPPLSSRSSRTHSANLQQQHPQQDKDIFSFKKHSMDYFTVNGVVLRTGYRDPKYWYILCIKELLDNAVDFLWKHYRGHKDTSVTAHITMSDSLLHIKIRNSNSSKNIPVFQHPKLIFDPDIRYGSKQDVKTISRGMLGDALKQILAFGYVIIHSSDDGTAFTNDQWNNPLIVRSNGKETHIRIIVDRDNQTHELDIKDVKSVGHNDIEIELSLPMRTRLDVREIAQFCRSYALPTTDISFKFRIVENSSDSDNDTDDPKVEAKHERVDAAELGKKIIESISSPARKAAIKIDYPALHPISTEWDNTWTINTLMPDEFVSTITGVYDKASVTVYERLRSGREGNRVKKSAENMMSIAEFMSMPDYRSRLEKMFWDLKTVLPPPKEVSMPYSDIKQRKRVLTSRLCSIAPLLDPDKAVYKVIRGSHNDDKAEARRVYDSSGSYIWRKGTGILQYPLSIEFMVVPYHRKNLGGNTHRASIFIGSVNYSLSPKSNQFEGEYSWFDKKKGQNRATDMKDMLEKFGFRFWEESAPKVKIPSVILVNIICQRIDYHGHDKSRIDTYPFSETMIRAAKKIAESVKTFQGENFVFRRDMEHEDVQSAADRKMTAKSLIGKFLDRIKSGGSLEVNQAELGGE